MSTENDVAIVGLAGIFPKAPDLKGFWNLIRMGIDAVSDVPNTHWNPDDYFDGDPKSPDMTYCRRGGFISPLAFDPTEFSLPPTVLEATDTSQLLGLVCARAALEDAGYGTGKAFNREMTSVILGVTGTLELVIPLGARLGHPIWRRALLASGVDAETTEEVVRRIADDYVPWQENSFPGLLGNVVAGRIANRLDLQGTNCVVDAACASSLSALHMGVMELQGGRADMVVTGGVDTFNDIFMFMCFSKTPALSPSGQIRPFDQSADGTMLGEGIGMIVLKRLADARKDEDRIYAVIRGVGTSSDGVGQAVYAPASPGQMRCLRDAYRVSGVDPATVELVEAHGTGTKVGDAVEFEALREVYSSAQVPKNVVALGSVKSNLGHTKAAAGAAGMIKTALSLYHKVMPATLKIEAPNPRMNIGDSPFYLNTETRPWLGTPEHPRRAALSSFGFGGSNFHVVLEEADPKRAEVAWDGSVQLFAFSGATRSELISQMEACKGDARAAGLSRQSFNHEAPFRALVVNDLAEALSALKAGKDHPALFVGQGPMPGEIAFLFPGQGSQVVGMGRELACVFPEMLESLEAVGREVTSRIYPPSVFTSDEREAQKAALTRTEVTQPALGAVESGLVAILDRFGVRPAVAAGHSYGELVALHAAGCIDRASLLALSKLRGDLMAGRPGEERGTMLAVSAPADAVRTAVNGTEVVLANLNSPVQTVLSGSRPAIAEAAQKVKNAGLKAVPLNVAAAFHSPLVASAYEPFLAGLSDVEFAAPRFPVLANATADPYPDDARQALASQLVSPVRWVELMENLYAAGARIFVEVGPRKVLTGLAQAILGNREHENIALDGGLVELARGLARLAALGYPVQLENWEILPPEPRQKRMEVQLVGSNYRSPRPASQENVSGNGGKAPVVKPAAPALPAAAAPAPPVPVVPATPVPVAPAPPVATAQANPAVLEALRGVQSSLAAMQALQSQTATLHQRFLESQEMAQRTFLEMLHGQQRLVSGMLGTAPPQPVALPAPTVYAPPAPVAYAPPAPVAYVPPAAVAYVPPAPVAPPVPAPVASAPPAAPKQPTVDTPAAHAGAEKVLLAVVSEKTGYPVEMLHLEMDLEADLGIDSIKRVEILAAIEERMPGMSRIEADRVGSLRTLREVLQASGATAAAAPAMTAAPSADLSEALLGIVSDKTGYPREMLHLDMDMESDLGIDSIKRVEILAAVEERMPGAIHVPADRVGSLRTLREVLTEGGVAAAPATVSVAAVAAPSDVAEVLLAIVADKTGYPREMLHLEMDLESDLGIDSIKRVEILAALEEARPGSGKIAPDQVGSLRTLGQIVATLGPVSAVPAAAPSAGLSKALLEAVSEKTGYPLEMLSLTMDLEADLGIDSIKRVEILGTLEERQPGAGRVSPDRMGSLRTLQDVLNELQGGAAAPAPTPAAAAAPAVLQQLERKRVSVRPCHSSGPAVKLAHVAVFDPSGEFGAAIVDHFAAQGVSAHLGLFGQAEAVVLVASGRHRYDSLPGLKESFQALKGLAGRVSLVATVTRMDGSFGFTGGDYDATAGGLAGLARTVAHEWPGVTCRALDVAQDWDRDDAAQAVVQELLEGGPLEVGLSPEGRCEVAVVDCPVHAERPQPLAEGDVVIITGGARGVTAAVAEALAREVRPTLVLLGRSPEPFAEPDWLRGSESEADLKRAIASHRNGSGALRPAELEEAFRRFQANREVTANLERMRAAGSQVAYYSADVRDRARLEEILTDVRTRFGPIRGLVHGAGVLADKKIVDKLQAQFDSVFDTKILGLRHLLELTESDPLKCLLLFSSVTARYGRPGQVDYCMANDILNKVAHQEAARRLDCRVASLGWGPWAGGMVNEGLAREFTRLGVGLIDVPSGALALVKELTAGHNEVELLLGSGLPSPEPPSKPAVAPAAPSLAPVLQLKLSIGEYPFLASHVLGGRPVLPLAMMMEWFGHAALHANPGLRFAGLEDVAVFKGVAIENGALPVAVAAGPAQPRDQGLQVPVELVDPNSGRVHARARVLLQPELPTAPAWQSPSSLRAFGADPEQIYAKMLFHGPHFHAIHDLTGISDQGLTATLVTAPKPAQWMADPPRSEWLTDPLVLDGVLQLGILWTHVELGKPSLPSRMDAYHQFQPRFPKQGVRAELFVRRAHDSLLAADVRLVDAEGVPLALFEGLEWTADSALTRSFEARTALNVP